MKPKVLPLTESRRTERRCATPQQIEKYHKLLIYFAKQRRNRPPPTPCKRCQE